MGNLEETYLYHMTGDRSTDLSTGYIGVTNNMVKRKSNHRRRPRNDKIKSHIEAGNALHFRVLYTGEREACLLLEAMLRPWPGIGWNEKSGGDVKTKHSENSITKNSLAKIGNKSVGKAEDHHFFGKRVKNLLDLGQEVNYIHYIRDGG